MDAVKFKETFVPLTDSLYRIARNLLDSEENAHDAVQDTFVRLWNMRDSLDTVLNHKAYAFVLVRNICLDMLRKESIRQSEQIEEQYDLSDDEPSPDKALIQKEQITLLMKAMGQLPEKQQLVLKLRIMEEMDYKDIATETGLTEGNLRVLLTMARKNLKKILENGTY